MTSLIAMNQITSLQSLAKRIAEAPSLQDAEDQMASLKETLDPDQYASVREQAKELIIARVREFPLPTTPV